MRAFFILAYPRSRTAWLAKALTTDAVTCLHEGFLGMRSVEELRDKMQAQGLIVGNSDSSNLLFIDGLRRAFPAARFICVYRPEADISASLLRNGLSGAGMKLLRAPMQRARSMTDVLQVSYDSLSRPETGKAIWEFCIGTPFDAERWTLLTGEHVESDLNVLAFNMRANRPAAEALMRVEGVA